jgi:hypothetical protein
MKMFNMFLAHSESKKPYASQTIDDMEYGATPFPRWVTPRYPLPRVPWIPGYPRTPPPPGINEPSPGPDPTPSPGPGPGPSPGPSPSPTPPPIYTCRGCLAYDFEFCPNGPCVPVEIWDYCPSDPIVSGGPWFGNASEGYVTGGARPVYCPGSSTSVHLSFATKKGGLCSARGRAKDPELCRNCTGTGSIGYTTTGMQINEVQQLSSTCGVGPGGNCNATWSLTGGGSITSGGLYTAPASNANCTNNPIITLSCGGSVVATLALAINGSSGTVAYQKGSNCISTLCMDDPNCPGPYCQCSTPCYLENCTFILTMYGCNGTVTGTPSTKGGQAAFCKGPIGTCVLQATANDNNSIPHTFAAWCSSAIDVRSTGAKAAGCCPAELL